MGAPLLNRFNRYFDRDTKVFIGKDTRIIPSLRIAKNKAKAYVLTPKAAQEAGKIAQLPPDKLMWVLREIYMPAKYVWVELPWGDYISVANEGFGVPYDKWTHPTKVGLVYAPTLDDSVKDFLAFLYYQFPSGASCFSPNLAEILQEPTVTQKANEMFRKHFKDLGVEVAHAGLGFGYSATHAKHKKTLDFLARRIEMLPLSPALKNLETWTQTLMETNGMARMALAVLALVAAASQKRYVSRLLDKNDKQITESDREPSDAYREISLFLDAEPSAEEAVKALRKAAGVRKRYHEVAGHYAYRHHHDGNPRVCTAIGRDGHHEFEKVSEKREECVHCGQQRWFKAEFHRGDPSLGTAPSKVRIVR